MSAGYNMSKKNTTFRLISESFFWNEEEIYSINHHMSVNQ
jgi:hypothetical protein